MNLASAIKRMAVSCACAALLAGCAAAFAEEQQVQDLAPGEKTFIQPPAANATQNTHTGQDLLERDI